MSNRELSAEFLSSFKTTSNEVTQRLEADSLSAEELTKAQIALVKLRKALVQAEEFLPRYDQRQVDEQLKALEALLEQKKASSAPKSRFAFKKAASSSSARSAPPPPPAIPVASRPPPTPALDATANVELASLSHAYVTLPSDLPSSGFSVSLASLSHCIINLLPAPRLSPEAPRSPPITALHIQDLSSCLLIVPDVEGSVLINGFDNCALDVGCWQLRMHRARQTDVFVSMTGERGTPVIEDCKDVRFGPRMLAVALTAAPEPLTVLDFSHPNPTIPSPNFRLLEPTELGPVRRLLVRAASREDEWTAGQVAAVLREWEALRETVDER